MYWWGNYLSYCELFSAKLVRSKLHIQFVCQVIAPRSCVCLANPRAAFLSSWGFLWSCALSSLSRGERSSCPCGAGLGTGLHTCNMPFRESLGAGTPRASLPIYCGSGETFHTLAELKPWHSLFHLWRWPEKKEGHRYKHRAGEQMPYSTSVISLGTHLLQDVQYSINFTVTQGRMSELLTWSVGKGYSRQLNLSFSGASLF